MTLELLAALCNYCPVSIKAFVNSQKLFFLNSGFTVKLYINKVISIVCSEKKHFIHIYYLIITVQYE